MSGLEKPGRQGEEDHIEAETGARSPSGSAIWVITALCLGWSLFQLAIASFITLDSFRVRVVHLAFAIALGFLLFPAGKKSPRDRIPLPDWVLAAVASMAVLYLFVDYDGLRTRPGAPLGRDIVVGVIGIVLLLEATRRALGPALAVVAGLFLAYSFLGPYLPEILEHRGYSLRRVADHQFLTSEGVFGVALGVSASYVFLFVLFGSLLEKAGAGNYFIQLSYSLLGRFRGGPAKAAILSSGLTGMVNGSSVSNTVTTGTFTIPLMKKVGYPPEKAAAIEVAASTDGQLMPPIMGAAAFIMAEFLGITYMDVVRAAIIPAMASYFTLFYISHLEALKLGLEPRPSNEIPPFLHTFARGAHYLIPVIALVVSLVVYRYSPVTAAFNSILILMFIMIAQKPALALAGRKPVCPAVIESFADIYNGLVSGARNMIGIGLATAVSGIIVGAVTLTGLGLRVVEIVEVISMGWLPLMLLITAIACLALGMGLPTTATYIVMATLTAPVIVALSEDMGFAIPMIAAHLFVFYFGILADDTPPVGLCAYAASGIAGSDPVRTGIQSFTYDIRAAILPFMFVVNTEILLIGVSGFLHGFIVFTFTVLGMFAFASATQGYALSRLGWGERAVLLVVTLLMTNPPLVNMYLPAPSEYVYSAAGFALFAAIVARQWLAGRAMAGGSAGV